MHHDVFQELQATLRPCRLTEAEQMEILRRIRATEPVDQRSDDFDVLVRSMVPYVFYFLKLMRVRNHEIEDAVQEAMIGIVSAIRHFEFDRGVMLKTFVGTAIKRRILSFFRKARKKRPRVAAIHTRNGLISLPVWSTPAIEKDELAPLLDRMLREHLTERRQALVKARLGFTGDEMDFHAMGQSLGVSHQAVHQGFTLGLMQLRRAVEDDGRLAQTLSDFEVTDDRPRWTPSYWATPRVYVDCRGLPLCESEQRLLRLLHIGTSATLKDLSVTAGFSREHARWAIHRLRDRGLANQVCPRGGWVLTPH